MKVLGARAGTGRAAPQQVIPMGKVALVGVKHLPSPAPSISDLN